MSDEIKKSDRTWAVISHLSALVMLVGVPFGNLLGPLVVWLIKKDEMPAINETAKESLNFQISMTAYMLISGLLIFVFIGFLLLPILFIADVVLVIIAAVKASNGENFSYPCTFRLLK